MSSRSNNDDDERKPPALAPSATLSNDDADANHTRVVVAKGEKTPAQIRAITKQVLETERIPGVKTSIFHRFLNDDGGEWFRVLDIENYEVTDKSPLSYLNNPNILLYHDPVGKGWKVCLSLPQDDSVVLNALPEHFTLHKPTMAEVARFFNKFIHFGNWKAFHERNKETIKRRITQGQNRRLPPILADLLDDMETAGRAMPPRDNPAPRAPETETQDFKSVLEAMQTTSERQLATFRDLSDRQATMFRDTTTEQRLAGERQAEMFRDTTTEQRLAGERQLEMFRNLTTEQRVANDNNLAALLASQQAEREQNALNLKMLADSQTKQLSMLAKSIRSKSAPRGGSPRIVHTATERKANRVRGTPTSINPRRLVVTPAKTPAKTPAVKRVLKDGCCLPTNQRGAECRHCRNAWEKRYAFCAHHETLLGERSEVE